MFWFFFGKLCFWRWSCFLFLGWTSGSIKRFTFRLGISCLEVGANRSLKKTPTFEFIKQLHLGNIYLGLQSQPVLNGCLGDFQPFPFIRWIANHLPSLHLGLEDDFSFGGCVRKKMCIPCTDLVHDTCETTIYFEMDGTIMFQVAGWNMEPDLRRGPPRSQKPLKD